MMAFIKDYWTSYMKAELIKRGYEHCDDIKWEDKEKFWVPVRRYDSEK